MKRKFLINLLSYFVIILTWFIVDGYKYRFFKNNPFPYEKKDDSIIDITGNNTDSNNNNNQTTKCLNNILGDGRCDEQNNNDACNYDGGDCCAADCIKNCELKKQTKLPCLYECGINSYQCLSTQECSSCISNQGTCKPMGSCMKESAYLPILKAIDACKLNSTSMGTINTIDAYCGKDPIKNIIHLPSDPTFHFPGCGIISKYCTKLPCCDVVQINYDTSLNCTSEKQYRTIYDDSTKTFSTSFISCLDYYKDCFIINQAYRGQCCECDDGWGGTDCSIPLCKNQCSNGYCSYKDECTCFPGYSGIVCETPLCAKECINGICTDTDYCECYYGWTGDDCTVRKFYYNIIIIAIKYPFCINGKASSVDTCTCDIGWEGNLCEIKVCNNCKNGICNDDGSCKCNIDYKSTDPENNALCDEIVDCQIYTPNCYKCDITNGKCKECFHGYYLLYSPINDMYTCSKYYYIINNS